MASEMSAAGLRAQSGSHWYADGLWRHDGGWMPAESSQDSKERRPEPQSGGLREGWGRQNAAEHKRTGQVALESLPSTKLCGLSFALGTRATRCLYRRKARTPFSGRTQLPAGTGDHGEKPHSSAWPGSPPRTPDSGQDCGPGRFGSQTHQEVFLAKHFAVDKIKGFSSQLPA